LLIQFICTAFDFAFAKAGSSIPAKIAIIAITTSNSMRVNAFSFLYDINFNKFS